MPEVDGNGTAEQLLTVSEVAGKLSCSCAYAVMMFNASRLGEVHVGEDGVRRVAASAVNAYVQTLGPRRAEGIAGLQQAALDAGMYDIPDERYAGFCREPFTDEEPKS
jgi:hypothetical protein